MTQAVSSPPSSSATVDLATTLHQAVLALQGIIESKPDMDRLLAEMVRLCAGALQAGGAGVWVTETPDKPGLILEHNLPALQILVEGVVAKGVLACVRRCAREGKPLIVPPFASDDRGTGSFGLEAPPNPSPLELMLVPMRLAGGGGGGDAAGLVLLMAVPGPREGDTHYQRTCLNFLARQVAAVEQTLTQRHLSLVEKDRGRSNKLVRFTEQVHKHLFLAPVAADIANLARDVLEAQRVTVELYPRLKKRVIAVSNVDEPNSKGGIMQVLRLIFDYVRDRQVPVVIDRNAATQLVSDPALQDASAAYFLASTFDAFIAAPIKSDDPTSPVLGVMLVEYAAAERAQANSTFLSEIARLCTSAVQNALDLESLPLIKPFWAVRSLWRKPTSSGKALALTLVTLLTALIIALAVVPFDFAIKADCQVRPRAQLSIVAPLAERIISVPVRAGEHVYPRAMQQALGDKVKPLAVFDSIELVGKRAEASGQLAALQVEQNDAQKKNDMTKISSLQNQIEQVKSELARLDHQIDQCTLWSPIEGTVLTENVEQKQYSTPRQGEELMDVASFSDWELVVDVPESEVASVRTALENATKRAAIDGTSDQGIEIEYILYPWPDTRYSIQARGTATILPAAQQSKSANVFRLQVKLDPSSLPPGIAMSGVTGRAKVHVGTKPLLPQWTRGLVRMVKMTLFF